MIDLHLRHATAAQPNEVFLYSVKHDYPALADQAAVLTLNSPTTEFIGRIRAAGMTDDVVIRWVCCPFPEQDIV